MNVVAIGGGTGLSTLLRGLKKHVGASSAPSIASLSAIVTVTDEGGSSGILRKELGMLPPGDIRNCIIALAQEEKLLSQLFSFRFGSGAVQGHSFGNLALAALTQITGSFDKAVLAVSEVLRVNGSIFPSTLSDVRVRATCADGTELVGELAISGDPTEPLRPRPEHARITRLHVDPPEAEPIPQAIEAIRAADLILIGPGSVYTSILPNLLIQGLADELHASRALRVYICNVMTQPGETDGFTAEEHLGTILDHAGPVIDVMIVNERRPSERTLEAYAAQHQFPVACDPRAVEALNVRPFFGEIISEGNYLRHDSDALAKTVFRLFAKRLARGERR